MKRLLSIFIVACALVSCENGGELTGPSNDPKAIAFGEVSTTRAEVTADDIKEFGVFAFVSQGEVGGSKENVYEALFVDEEEGKEFEERVYWDDTINGWTYDNIQFWLSNRNYHFWGIYPYSETASTVNKDVSGNPTGFSRTFTTPEKANEDLLVAHSGVETTGETTPASVEMNFDHALSKVFFKVHYDTVGNQDDKFVLKEFSISNIKKVGTLTTTLNGGKSWSANQTQNMNFSWKKDGGQDLESELNLWTDGLMLIPQTIAPSAVNIRVKYLYKDGQEGGDTYEEKVVDTYLPAITWNAGAQYTYKMTLHEDDYISFKQIEVATWGSPQQGGAIIIK